MNIEPAMLLMLYSMPKYAGFTAQLLEFLMTIMEVYFPPAKELIKKGVRNSLNIMLSKGVIQYHFFIFQFSLFSFIHKFNQNRSLEPLVNCVNLDPIVKQKVIACFGPHMKPPIGGPSPGSEEPPKKKFKTEPPRKYFVLKFYKINVRIC